MIRYMDYLPGLLEPLNKLFINTLNVLRDVTYSFLSILNTSGVISENDLFIIFLAVNVLFGLFLYLLIKYLSQLFYSFPKTTASNDLPTSEEDLEVLKKDAYAKALKILEEARFKSLQVISDSHIQAQQVLEEVTGFTADAKTSLQNNLTSITEKHLESLKEMSSSLLNTYDSVIKEQLGNQLEGFGSSLKSEVLKTQHDIDTKIEKEYENALSSVEQYKSELLHKIDTSIYEILTVISTDVLGKALSLEEHEAFILKSIEEAKKSAKFL